jgi:hypothetical protein
LSLAKFFLDRLVGQLAWVDAEPLLEHLRVLLVVDLVGKLSEGFLNVLVLALLPKQIDDLLLVELHRRLPPVPRRRLAAGLDQPVKRLSRKGVSGASMQLS